MTHELIAPCCWREAIAIHRSEEARQMLNEVKQLVIDGRSEDEIKAIYVARYGVRILADPPGRTGQWLYMVPVGAAVRFDIPRHSCVCVRWWPASRLLLPHAPAELMAQVRMETENEWN